MTKEQKMEAFSMLLDGESYEAVGRTFGLTRQRIQQMFPMMRNEKMSQPKERPLRYVYPGIEKWMRENKITIANLSRSIGYTTSAVNQVLLGKNDPRKRFVDEVLALTGMTYEEAFKQ